MLDVFETITYTTTRERTAVTADKRIMPLSACPTITTLIQFTIKTRRRMTGNSPRRILARVETPVTLERGQVSGPAAAFSPTPNTPSATAVVSATGITVPP